MVYYGPFVMRLLHHCLPMLFCVFFFYFAHKIYICRQVTQFPLLANLVTLQNFPRVCFRIFYELDELDKNLNQTCLIDSLKPKTYFRVFFLTFSGAATGPRNSIAFVNCSLSPLHSISLISNPCHSS